jgi:hypothetical protein
MAGEDPRIEQLLLAEKYSYAPENDDWYWPGNEAAAALEEQQDRHAADPLELQRLVEEQGNAIQAFAKDPRLMDLLEKMYRIHPEMVGDDSMLLQVLQQGVPGRGL